MNCWILVLYYKLFASFIIYNEPVYIWGSKLIRDLASKINFISNSIPQNLSLSNLCFCINRHGEYKRKYEIRCHVAYKTTQCDPRLHELMVIPI